MKSAKATQKKFKRHVLRRKAEPKIDYNRDVSSCSIINKTITNDKDKIKEVKSKKNNKIKAKFNSKCEEIAACAIARSEQEE